MIDLQRNHCENQRIGDCVDKDCNDCSARVFYNAGYRKESDTAREILKWLKAAVIMTEIPHGSEPCEEDVEAVMWWLIEEHFKEKYGVDLGE